jgi:beta-glucanase (GH16 family)
MTHRALARRSTKLLSLLALAALPSCIAPGPVTAGTPDAPAATVAGPTVAPPQPGAALEPLFDELDRLDEAKWRVSDKYANGPIFHCGWRKENARFEGGRLALRVDNEGCPEKCSGRPYAAGELQSVKKYGYGRYEARMKPAKLNGAMSGSVFTYNDQPQDEIDIEFIGKDPTIVQSNYFTNGVGQHGRDIQLGFDATESFHDYAFEWRPNSITWFVDGKPVHREDGSRGPLPRAAGAFVVNVWPGNTVDSWLGKLSYEKPVAAEYEWVRFTPLSELAGESPAALSIPKPAGVVPSFSGAAWLVDDFEKSGAAQNGGTWLSEMDPHDLGTTISPKPFAVASGGAPASPGHSAHISGHLGPSKAPWPYAVLSVDLMPPSKPTDLRGFKAIELWVKGDGRQYRMQLTKSSVTDWGHFSVTISAPSSWTKLTFPLAQFAQPDWAKKVEATLQDVTHLTFGALEGDKDFDLSVDEIRFLK